MAREVVVTGVGLVSGAGEGIEAHLAALKARVPPPLDETTFAPYAVHPAAPIELDLQIPKKSDQRQMEPWQRLGVYAAGLALEAAGLKDDLALKGRMHLIVAAGGGERDYAVDGQILSEIGRADNAGAFLNERLMSDLRPTLFLAQLSNLLAGNISIVHGVTGASRTFMGEEASGLDAIRVGAARIASGQNDIFLVGGSYNAERPDVLLIHEMGGYLWKGPYRSVWERGENGGGFIVGTAAAFLVLEAREHAQARSAPVLATVTGVASDRSRRAPGDVGEAIRRQWAELGASAGATIVSGATGIAAPTMEERDALDALAAGRPIFATGDLVGQALEAQAPAGVCLAAALIAAEDAAEVVVTSIGHLRGEGMVRLRKTREVAR